MRICVVAALLLPLQTRAAELWQGADGMLRWDNTLRYAVAARTEGRSASLLNDPNSDDGNLNFGKGPISNRVDWLSEFSLDMGGLGVEASAAAWVDSVYLRRTDHNNAASFNPVSVAHARLPRDVRNLHGRKFEVLNAFVHGEGQVGHAPLSFRVGRSAVLWGESLFFADNGISAGQAPVDAIKALSSPGAKAQEVFMPVAQAWASVQPRPGLALEAYYQLEWRKNRLPGAGSYFSAADFLDAGGERLIVGPGQFFRRGADRGASHAGQFGVAARLSGENADFGLYALRTHAKDPQIYLRFGPFLGRGAAGASAIDEAAPTTTGLVRERAGAYGLAPGAVIAGPGNALRFIYSLYGNTATGEVGTYDLAYPRGIEMYGASFNGYAGDSTVAGEISVRRKTPLASEVQLILPNAVADAGRNARYAIGTTLHGQASILSVLAPGRMWDSATFAAEIAGNTRLDITRNPAEFDTTRTRGALSVRASFEPQYFTVLPGLDLSVPMGFGYGLVGRSSVIQGQVARMGDAQIGVRITYRAVWQAGVTFTHYIGPVSRQPLADRDFISLSVQRTF